MYKKSCRKRIVAAALSAIMIAGGAAGSMPGSMVQAAEQNSMLEILLPKEDVWEISELSGSGEGQAEALEEAQEGNGQEAEEENWYVLGRPMTEEEREEQARLVEYYRSFLKEIPKEQDEQARSLTSAPVRSSSRRPTQVSVTSAAVELPRKYSSRDQGYTTAVRSQLSMSCWAFTATACMEISMVKNNLATADSLKLSVPHGIYYYFRPVADPLGGTSDDYPGADAEKSISYMWDRGGSIGLLAETTMAWMGPVSAEHFPYEYADLAGNYHTYTPSQGLDTEAYAYGNRAATVTEMAYVDTSQQEQMKKAILEYGAVGVDYYSSTAYYNYDHAAQYAPVDISADHAVTVVGWNDDFPRQNFNSMPSNNGAWLVRNSWGAGYGDGGYFWLSYEDKSLETGRAYKVVAADKYDNNYQYDGVGSNYALVSAKTKLEAANVFTMQEERELLQAVQFSTWEPGYSYSIQIYKNPSADNPASGEALLDAPITGTKQLAGRYTIDLEKPEWLEKGDRIAVCVTLTSTNPSGFPIAEVDRPGSCQEGQSFYRLDDGNWTSCTDVYQGNFLIKAFTSVPEGGTAGAHEHSWASGWKYDADYHWHECNGGDVCDASLSEAGRGYAKHHGGTASCIAKARCADCGQEYGFLSNEHVGGEVCTICNKEIPISERKGVANPSFDFTTITDETVSSAANGKPKLIVLFDDEDAASRTTMLNLISKKFPGVEICAVETSLEPKADVESFKASLGAGSGLENIQFCYEPVRGQEIKDAYVDAYTEVYTDASTDQMPLLCYIDGKNSFKYMTSGSQDVEQIKKNLIDYCGYYDVNILDRQNPVDATYTTIEDTQVSSAADGKPKVLIFFHAEGCGSSESTLSDIAKDVPSGVDILAIDMMGREKDKVVNFKNTHTSTADGIDYCYGGYVMEDLIKYMEAGGLSTNPIASPVICYIDADNKLQYVSGGESTGEDVRKALSTCCDYVESDDGTGEPEVPVNPVVKLLLNKPAKTTYLVGESLNLEGGTIAVEGAAPAALTEAAVTGFNSSQQGVVPLTVKYQGGETSFPILVINKPSLEATKGMTLADVELPQNGYGTFTWENVSTKLDQPGTQSYPASFTPADTSKYSSLGNIGITVNVVEGGTVTPPVDPEKPIDPDKPVDPDPDKPVDPEQPVDPDKPIDPDPVDPVDPDPVDPVNPVDPDPVDPVNPDPVDPVDPDPVDPVDPDPVDPVDPDPVNPVDPDPVNPADPDPGNPADPDPANPADPDPANPVDPDPANPVDPDPANPIVPDPPVERENPFIDISEGAFYYNPVLWAVDKGVTTGATPTTFVPARGCTRAEIVTFLYRAMNGKASEGVACKFTDVKEGTFYYDAVLWAIENGVTTGTSPTTFTPNRICTRAEIATFLYRAMDGKVGTGTTCKFTDVKEGAFYYNAVLWAIEEGITTGTSPTTFTPQRDCTRGECVTFLYRMLEESTQ